MNFTLIFSIIKNFTCKEVAVETVCFISDPLSYNTLIIKRKQMLYLLEIIRNCPPPDTVHEMKFRKLVPRCII